MTVPCDQQRSICYGCDESAARISILEADLARATGACDGCGCGIEAKDGCGCPCHDGGIGYLAGELAQARVDLTLARESESRRFGEWMEAVEDLGAARRDLHEAMRLLRPLEWSGRNSYTGRKMCPECRALEHLGRKHADGCALAAILARP